MIIWGAGTARSFRPLWVAEELGLDYEHKPIAPRSGQTKTPEYTALNRKQKIPLLEDGDFRLSESVAICRYLIEAYPSETLSPLQTLKERVREDEWCCYIYGEIDETSLYVMRRHQDLSEIYGASETVVKSASAYAAFHLQVLAERLEGREYLMKSGFGLPDMLLVSCIDWALFYGVPVPETLQTYKNAIAQRPAYQRAMAINYKELLGAIDGTAVGN